MRHSSLSGWASVPVVVLALGLGRPIGGAVAAERSAWVHRDDEGKLVYRTTPAGDRILDFSHAGYRGGGVSLPAVPTRATVTPGNRDDDTAAIQAALDQVAALPLQAGFRGAVELAPGVFTCARPLTIGVSGVVLRGAGSGAVVAGPITTLKMAGAPHNAITVRMPGSGREQPAANEDAGAALRTTFADRYVPCGTRTFTVASAAGFAVGDEIAIQRPVTAAWVRFMEMHDLVRDGKPQTWIRTGTMLTAERRIAALEGNRITVDVPLADSYDARHLAPPGASVVRTRPTARLSQIGIENLCIVSPSQAISHEQAHFTALRLTGEDCWVRDVVIHETMNSVGVSGRRITLERVTVNRKARHQGSSRPAEFAPNASQVLLDRCAVNADNVWFVATGAGIAGPIVILNGDFRGDSRAESHQRWSTGILFDNCRAPAGGIELRNRGSMGSGHGWSMGWGVIWNCVAKDYLVQNPPGAVNWLIGSTGKRGVAPRPFGSGPMLPGGIDDSPDRPVAPTSLYLAQLAERLGPQALKNIGYASADPAGAKPPRLP